MLVVAPTGSGKTLAAFLSAIDRLGRAPEVPERERLRVLYVSPLKALPPTSSQPPVPPGRAAGGRRPP